MVKTQRQLRPEIPERFSGALWLELRDSWCLLMAGATCLLLTLPLEKFFPAWLLAAVLSLLALGDYRYGLLYDSLVLLLFVLGIVPLSCGAVTWLEAVGGSLLGGGLLYAVRQLSHGGLGLGDVKLIAALGPWLGWQNIILCLLLSSCLGTAYGLLRLLQGKMTRHTALPFGPFLALGAVLAFVWGDSCWRFWEALYVSLW